MMTQSQFRANKDEPLAPLTIMKDVTKRNQRTNGPVKRSPDI